MERYRHLVFLILAILCFIIATLLDADFLIHGSHVLAWLGAGSAFFAAAHLP